MCRLAFKIIAPPPHVYEWHNRTSAPRIRVTPWFFFFIVISLPNARVFCLTSSHARVPVNLFLGVCRLPGGGGGTSILKVTGTCRWTGYDFAVINISTGYLVALFHSSILAQGIFCPLALINIGTGYLNRPNWLLAGYSVITGLLPRGSQPTMFMTGPRSGTSDGAILRQGMHMQIFSQVYVTGCIFCAPSALRQGQVFDPQRPPPVHMKVECPPPPPGAGSWSFVSP